MQAGKTFGLLSGDGYLEFKAVETDTRRTVGFKSGTGAAQTYADLAHAIDLGAACIVTLFENGISRGTFGTYAHGDRFRIEIHGHRRRDDPQHGGRQGPPEGIGALCGTCVRYDRHHDDQGGSVQTWVDVKRHGQRDLHDELWHDVDADDFPQSLRLVSRCSTWPTYER